MRLRILPLLVVIVLGLTACGGDAQKKNDYINAVNQAQTGFQSRFQKLQQKITAVSTPKQDDATLREFGKAVDDVIVDLKAIKPPPEVKDLHATFVKEVQSYGAVAEQARKDFKSDDPQAVIAANRTFTDAITKTATDITSTINEINRTLQD